MLSTYTFHVSEWLRHPPALGQVPQVFQVRLIAQCCNNLNLLTQKSTQWGSLNLLRWGCSTGVSLNWGDQCWTEETCHWGSSKKPNARPTNPRMANQIVQSDYLSSGKPIRIAISYLSRLKSLLVVDGFNVTSFTFTLATLKAQNDPRKTNTLHIKWSCLNSSSSNGYSEGSVIGYEGRS